MTGSETVLQGTNLKPLKFCYGKVSQGQDGSAS